MIVLNDLWTDLFDEPITPLEENMMEGIVGHVDESDSVIVLAAIIVHMLTKVLLQDPASPFVIASTFTKSIKDLEVSLNVIRREAGGLHVYLSELRGDAEITRQTLKLARVVAKERRKIPPPVLELNPDTGHSEWEHTLAPNAMRKIYVATAFSSLFGATIVSLLMNLII